MWHYFDNKIIKLGKELTFVSDMRISLWNKKERMFFGFSNKIVGEFSIPVSSMLERCEHPQFFNLLNEEGQFMG